MVNEISGKPDEQLQPPSQQEEVDEKRLTQQVKALNAQMRRDSQELKQVRETQEIPIETPWFIDPEEWSDEADPRLGVVRNIMQGEEKKVRLPKPAEILNPNSSHAQYIKLYRTEYGKSILAEKWKLDVNNPRFAAKLKEYLLELYNQGISAQKAIRGNQAIGKLTKPTRQ